MFYLQKISTCYNCKVIPWLRERDQREYITSGYNIYIYTDATYKHWKLKDSFTQKNLGQSLIITFARWVLQEVELLLLWDPENQLLSSFPPLLSGLELPLVRFCSSSSYIANPNKLSNQTNREVGGSQDFSLS